MKVAILGAAGFLGRCLSESMASAGIEVVAATRRPAAFGHAGIRNVVAPYADKDDFLPLLRDGAAVVHVASISTPGSSAAHPQLDGNLRTTLGLLEALQEFPGNRLVYISSGGTLYGDGNRAMPEDAPLRPRSYHAAGKIAAESFIRAWASQYPGTAIVLTVLGLTLVGESINDLNDPRLRGRKKAVSGKGGPDSTTGAQAALDAEVRLP